MNEETQNVLVGVGQEILSWLQGAGDLVAEQAPLLAGEVVARGILMNAMDAVWCLVWAVGGLVALKVGVSFIRKGKAVELDEDSEHDAHEPYFAFGFVCTIGGAIGAFVGFLTAFENVQTLLAIHVAPRVYLLEQLSKIVNQ